MLFNILNIATTQFSRICAPIVKTMGFVIASNDSLADKEGLLDEGNIQNFGQLASGIERVMKDLVGPIMIVVGALLAIFMIYVGVNYAKAEDANKRKEKLGQLVGIGVGLVIVLVGITMCYSINWVELYASVTGHRHAFTDTNPNDTYCDYCAQKADSIVHEVSKS